MRSPALPPLAMIATYPPRRCGIATFTRDLRTALVGTAEEDGGYEYPLALLGGSVAIALTGPAHGRSTPYGRPDSSTS